MVGFDRPSNVVKSAISQDVDPRDEPGDDDVFAGV